MKKTMLTILLTISAIIAVGLTYGFYRSAPLRNITLENAVVIDGEATEVFNMVRYLENFPRWSPFLAEDPGQKYEVRGEDGTIGATYHWNGRGGKDLGFQEIVRIQPNAHPTFSYAFKSTPQGVRVTQSFFGARKEMDATNKQGLALLKEAVETAVVSINQ